MRKKILYIFDVDPEIRGGAQQSMEIIRKELGKEMQFFCITPVTSLKYENHFRIEEYNDFFIRKNVNEFIKILKLISKFKNIINKVKPDIIHIQMPGSMMIISFMYMLKFIPNKTKVIYTDRNVFNKYSKKSSILLKILTKRLDEIITTTEYNKNLYINSGVNKEKVNVIPNTAGNEYEIYSDEMKYSVRNKFKISNDEIVVGFYGRVYKDKNWPLAIRLIDRMNEKYKFKVVLVLANDKTNTNIKECNEIINSVERIIGKERLIHLVNLSPEEVSKIYYLSDITIMTSTIESFGRVAVEAMARKNIVMATKVDGLKEVVLFENNLFDNEAEFMKKIERYFNNSELLNDEKNNFYNRFKENYSLNRNITMYRDLYNNI